MSVHLHTARLAPARARSVGPSGCSLYSNDSIPFKFDGERVTSKGEVARVGEREARAQRGVRPCTNT
eukprot:scaffold1947_cov207-Prasinococcus_capsulatus_cf.AAC.18